MHFMEVFNCRRRKLDYHILWAVNNVICLADALLCLLWSPYVIGQTIIFLWPPCVADADIIFLPCDFFLSSIFFFYSSPNLSGRRLDVYHTSTQWCGPSANLECRSEMCSTRLAGNRGRKNDAKNRHLRTIAHLCRAIIEGVRARTA